MIATRFGPDETDTDSGVNQGLPAHESSLTPIVVSPGPPPHPDPALSARGLPDFSALLAAELAAAGAMPTAQTRSSLGVGELILSAREFTGMPQRALASRAGTSQAAVTAIETGNRLPTVRTLMRLLDAAGFELVVGLRRPDAPAPMALGALVAGDDGLADYVPV